MVSIFKQCLFKIKSCKKYQWCIIYHKVSKASYTLLRGEIHYVDSSEFYVNEINFNVTNFLLVLFIW